MAFLPCPFCGNDKIHIKKGGSIECENCKTVMFGQPDNDLHVVVEAWNTRADLDKEVNEHGMEISPQDYDHTIKAYTKADLDKAVADERERCIAALKERVDEHKTNANFFYQDGDDAACDHCNELARETEECIEAIRNRGKKGETNAKTQDVSDSDSAHCSVCGTVTCGMECDDQPCERHGRVRGGDAGGNADGIGEIERREIDFPNQG